MVKKSHMVVISSIKKYTTLMTGVEESADFPVVDINVSLMCLLVVVQNHTVLLKSYDVA